MDRDRMIYSGLRCKVNTKAAFVDMCMENPALASKMLMSSIIVSECGKKVCALEEEEKEGVVAVKVELNEEKREQIYDDVFGDKLREGRFARLTDSHRKLLEPIQIMHKKEMEVDVIPFLAYGIARNSRCRSMLLQSAKECTGECLEAFRGSEYHTERFLRKFLLEERKAVKLAAGLMILLREEESDEKYRMVMDIIYAGYRSVKNKTKKLDCLSGEAYQDIMEKDQVAELLLSQMVIQMVIAEDLGIPLAEDYKFCQVVCMLKDYENDRLHPQEKEIDMTEGKRIYRKFLRDHWEPGAYYVSAFLEKEDGETFEMWEKMEDLLNVFGMEIRALYGLNLEKWEAEMLCTIFEEKDWERYRYFLLIATLCKYIQQIESMYENEIPEEVQYRKSCEEKAVREKVVKEKEMETECVRKQMEERVRCLKRQNREKENALAEAERRMERLKRECQKNEELHEKEKEELVRLREFIFRMKGEEDGEEPDRKGKEGKMFDTGRLNRSIVIGGHRNWQKKLRQCLPGSQFLASDYMNFDPAVLHNKKYIIVNTDILKHGLYYKIMNERKKGQKILYVHGNNVDRTLREIAKQIG